MPRPPESFFQETPPHVRAYIDQLHDFTDRRFAGFEIWIAELEAKLSFSTQSAKGSRFVECILTVLETCRRQNRNVSSYLAHALAAHFHRQPTPSLLPGV